MGALFAFLLIVLAVVLILLVLVQRGRGGGLAGALGGMGGSSAFGAKAGDVFTRITIYLVIAWITICIISVHWAKNRKDLLATGEPTSSPSRSLPGTTSGKSTLPESTLPINSKAGTEPASKSTQESNTATPAASEKAPPSSEKAPTTSEEPQRGEGK